MTSKYKTEQEAFWASEFDDWGREYIQRNNIEMVKNNINFFSNIFNRCNGKINSIIEFGSNVGLNLHAIDKLFNEVNIAAIEINKDAVKELEELPFIDRVYHESILEFKIDKKRDFVFAKGVLIHINPDFLGTVYDKLYNCSSKYVMIAEYYNPTPVTISYRGHKNKLFKRDFAGEMMNKFPDLKLVDYGFSYHRDNNFPQDDITWFLLEK